MIAVPTQNVVQLACGFFINFVAFNTQGFIEESVIDSVSRDGSINKHAGYYSLAIIYAFYTMGNLTAAQMVDVLTPKWAMCIGALCYGSFQVGFLFLNATYLYISSAVLGFGAAILWTGQGSYLSQNCTKETSSRMSALLWGMHECCLIGGGLLIYVVFSVTDSYDIIPQFTIKLLYTVFTVLSIISACVFSLLRIYPTCVSFSRQLGYNTKSLMALNLICIGIGQVSAADASLTKTNEYGMFWKPNKHLALAVGVLLGFADCCWNTQIMSLLCETYPEKSAQAFAIFKFYESALSCATFIFSSLVSLYWLLGTLSTFAVLALISFFIVERERVDLETTTYSVEIDKF